MDDHDWHPYIYPAGTPSVWSLAFWRQSAERAIQSAGSTFATILGGDWLAVIDLSWEVTWRLMVGTVVVSLAMSLASIPIGERRRPSAAPLNGLRR